MNRQEIEKLRDEYDKKSKYSDGTEEELGEKFRENGYVTKEDLITCVEWKLRGVGYLKGRREKTINNIKEVSSSKIREKTKTAFSKDSDFERIREIKSIVPKGIGNALVSVLLAFYDPENYGIMDRHSWEGIFGEEHDSSIYTDIEKAVKFFEKLREISSEKDLPCRDIEKAIFIKQKKS